MLEDHVQGCVRTAAEHGDADALRRRGHGRRPPDDGPAGRRGGAPASRPRRSQPAGRPATPPPGSSTSASRSDSAGRLSTTYAGAVVDSWITALTRHPPGAASRFRTVMERGASPARGPGRPGREPDRATEDRHPAHGAKPSDAGSGAHGRVARRPEEAAADTRPRDRSRRTSGTSRPSPGRLRRSPRRGPRRPRPDASTRPPGPRSTDQLRLLLAWTAAINLTAIRDPVAVCRRTSSDSLSGARRSAASRPTGSSTSAPAAATRACRWRSPSRPPSPARRLDRQEGALPRDRRGGDRSRATASRPPRPAPRRWRPTRGTANAGRLVTARAVGSLAELVELAFPLLRAGGCAHRLEARRPSMPSWWPPGEPRRRWVAGRSSSVAVTVPGLDGHVLVVATKTGPTPAGYPRDPAMRDRRPW